MSFTDEKLLFISFLMQYETHLIDFCFSNRCTWRIINPAGMWRAHRPYQKHFKYDVPHEFRCQFSSEVIGDEGRSFSSAPDDAIAAYACLLYFGETFRSAVLLDPVESLRQVPDIHKVSSCFLFEALKVFSDCGFRNVSELHHLTSNLPQSLPAVPRCSCHASATKKETRRPKKSRTKIERLVCWSCWAEFQGGVGLKSEAGVKVEMDTTLFFLGGWGNCNRPVYHL